MLRVSLYYFCYLLFSKLLVSSELKHFIDAMQNMLDFIPLVNHSHGDTFFPPEVLCKRAIITYQLCVKLFHHSCEF